MRYFKYISLLFFTLNVISLSFAQISPGPLAKAHAHLEGIANCTQCHTIGKAVTNKKCLDCHKEIQSLVTQKRGFHISASVKNKNCVECHNDHHGEKFDMIRFDQKKFDHNSTGYKLEGAHSKIECKDCHKPSNIKDNNIKKRIDTFLGLQRNCKSCHKDYHQNTLGDKCASCHNLTKFRPANGFDHNKSKFKLKGAHQQQECIECHKKSTKNGVEYQAFNGLNFSSCVSCHKDVHNGKFGINCLKCHNENSFKQPNLANGSFNHNATDYPLTGKHIGVDCKLCHKGNSFTNPINFTQCKNCHKDFHNGDFVKNGVSPDCKECHTLENPFTFTTYTIDKHIKSDFQLDGSHVATACISCHKSEEKWKFKFSENNCVDCHKDVHIGKISEQYYPKNDCKKCHSTELWSRISFDHTATGWKLEGKHATATCKDCHFKKDDKTQVVTQKFKGLTNQCVQCHDNIHGTQFETNGVTNCIECHKSSINWQTNNFDHSKTKFPLDGKHVSLTCNACHKDVQLINNKETRIYKLNKLRCIDCHS